jgi:YcaO-like protein with predicted kinase domain
MDHLGARKDAAAADTIERIHGILDALGFAREEARAAWWSAGPTCHSCHLRFANYPLIFSNGKGVTRELALASALAEFIERLQCRVDEFFTRAGNIYRLPLVEPRTLRTLDDVARDAPALVAEDLGALTPESIGGTTCLPCCDVFGRRVIDLPIDILRMMTGSTGMCAGNSAEEALTQGLCEVFERHAIHALSTGLVPGLPSMPLGSLPLADGPVRRQLEALRSAGTEVVVKDASLGGAFPVVALVLVDRATSTCHASFGSDPDFEIALTRCLTEAFQGVDRMVRPFPAADRATRPLDLFNHVEQLQDRLLADVGPVAISEAFGRVDDNRQALRFALDRARRRGLDVYVRDCSVFGFPAFYVYVRQLSALSRLTPARMRLLYREWDAVRSTLFGLRDATRDQVRRCARVLFDEVTLGSPQVEFDFARATLGAPVVRPLDFRQLLLMMLLESGLLGEAREMAARAPLLLPAPDRDARLDALAPLLRSYADARGGKVEAAGLVAAFERAFDRACTGTPRAARSPGLAPLPIPRCHSVYGCPACPCRRNCWLDSWRRLAHAMRERAISVDQSGWVRAAGFSPW